MNFSKTSSHLTRIAAIRTERKIYASLPWGYRLAQFLIHLAASASDNFGRMAYALFAYYGVKGLPEIKGKPGELALEKKPGEKPDAFVGRFLRVAPANYGKAFGAKMYGMLLKRTGKPTVAEDLLQDISVVMLGDTTLRRELSSGEKGLKQVESLAARSMINLGIELMERNDRYKELPKTEEGGDEPILDPSSWSRLDSMLSERELDELIEEVQAAVNPRLKDDVEVYFDLMLDGVSPKRIFDWRLLPSMRAGTKAEGMSVEDVLALDEEEREVYFTDNKGNKVPNPAGNPTTWYKKYVDPIKEVLKEHFAS